MKSSRNEKFVWSIISSQPSKLVLLMVDGGMMESQNPAIVAILRHRHSGLWPKNLQYRPILTIAASLKIAMYIRHSAAMENIL